MILKEELFFIPKIKTVLVVVFTLHMITKSPLVAYANVLCPELCLCYNRTVNCSNKSLTKVPENIANNTLFLDLSMNRLEELPSKIFDNLTELQSLNVAYNKLKSIQSIYDSTLKDLNFLNASWNEIRVLVAPSLTGKEASKSKIFQNLYTIDLSHNKIKRIQLYFSRFRSLKKLVLSYNRLSEINAGTFIHTPDLEELESLKSYEQLSNGSLDHNQLRTLANVWFTFKSNIKYLYLSSNRIEFIESSSFEGVKNVKYIDLSKNSLKCLNNYAFQPLHNLLYLDLGDNMISRIGELAFSGLKQLLVLNLTSNYVSTGDQEMDSVFFPLKSLQILDLSNNNALLIPRNAFQGLTNLKELDLMLNKIHVIEKEAFINLKNLSYLGFSTNLLTCDCSVRWLRNWLKTSAMHSNVNAICSTPLWLKNKSVISILDSELVCVPSELLTIRPKVVFHPKSKYAFKGGNFTLFCSAVSSSDNHMSTTWYHNGQLIDKNNVLTTSLTPRGLQFEESSRLLLKDISYTDEGTYWCRVKNLYGSSLSNKINITVVEPPRISPNLISPIVARSGEDILIACTAKGRPTPNVSFNKLNHGHQFHAVVDKRITYENQKFVITRLKIEDSGLYSCYAQNVAGSINRSISIVVREKPKFTRLMSNKAVALGETALLDCIVSGNPHPKIQWYKNDTPILPELTSRIKPSNQLLVIVDFSHQDEGLYACEASNRLGTTKQTARLIVDTKRTLGKSSTKSSLFIIVVTVIAAVIITSLVWVALVCFCCKKRRRAQISKIESGGENDVLGELPTNYTLRCNGKLISATKKSLFKAQSVTNSLHHKVPLLNDSTHHYVTNLKEDSDYSTLDSTMPTETEEDDSGISLVYPKYQDDLPLHAKYQKDASLHACSVKPYTINVKGEPLSYPNKSLDVKINQFNSSDGKLQTPLHRKHSNNYLLFNLQASALNDRLRDNKNRSFDNVRKETGFTNKDKIEFDPTRLKSKYAPPRANSGLYDNYVTTSSSGIESEDGSDASSLNNSCAIVVPPAGI